MKVYDIVVIGAGPAGSMAAIKAAQLGEKPVLIERNISIGRKILLTGRGRCNITNTAPVDLFVDKFGAHGKFFRTAFFTFSNQDLINLFESKGLKLKTERQGRVFPETDRASSVVKVLSRYLGESGVSISHGRRLKDITASGSHLRLEFDKKAAIHAKKVVLATGGLSYKATGSTGDGLDIARRLGHKITPLRPGLVPLRAAEAWARRLQGLTLRNVRIGYIAGKKKLMSTVGEIVFTHFGISGPLVLDSSRDIVSCLEGQKGVSLFIDLKPALSLQQLERRLITDFKERNLHFSNRLKSLLPRRLIPVFIELSGIAPDKKTNQITRGERASIITLLKSLPLTVTGALPIEEAMVTCGGVSTKEINPRTMESRIIPGLYFAGEIIDGCAPSGGYNLQMAFSTGYLAGGSAAA